MLFAPISSTKTNRWGFTLSETITLQATLSHSSRYHRPHRSPFFWLKPILFSSRLMVERLSLLPVTLCKRRHLSATVAAGRSWTSSLGVASW
jgi:hypothetical protein